MKMKPRTLTVLAVASVAVLLVGLFVPMFCGLLMFCPFTLSVWEWSPWVAGLIAVVAPALVLAPFVKPNTMTWLLPFLFGLTVVVLVLCATLHSFPLKSDLSNLLFHPDGLILFAIGGVLCISAGLGARAPLASKRTP
jgi:hypothetical protein